LTTSWDRLQVSSCAPATPRGPSRSWRSRRPGPPG